jgi:hypothetical protein
VPDAKRETEDFFVADVDGSSALESGAEWLLCFGEKLCCIANRSAEIQFVPSTHRSAYSSKKEKQSGIKRKNRLPN